MKRITNYIESGRAVSGYCGKPKWIIKDWTGKICFFGKEFDSFEDGEEFLCIELNDNYEEERGEYYVEEK